MAINEPGLAAELAQLSDRTLGLFIRAHELALEAYELLVPGALQLGEASKTRIALTTALRERERRGRQ